MPVGTILPYIGSLTDIPKGWHLCDGTDGTPDLTNRFLEGTIDAPGIFKEPGLPNITGRLYTSGCSGAIINGGLTEKLTVTWGDGIGFGMSTFSASWSNPIYGKSSTVQPKAYTVLYIIKIK